MEIPPPFFSSRRERHLWLWTLAVMVAIYSTLGPARMLVGTLREHNLLRLSFALVLLAVAGGFVWRWVKNRPDWREVGVALGVALAYLMVWWRINSWEERTHLIEYGIVAALIHQALLERVRNGRRVPMPAALTVLVTALLGSLDECIQAILPDRVFDVRDIFFNALAGFMVVAARLALARQQRPGWRVWFLWLMAAAFGWGEGVYWGWYDGTAPKTLQVVPAVIWVGYLGLVVGGTLIGVLQWLVLRRHVTGSVRWVWASLGAAVISGALVFGVGLADPKVGWIAGVSAFGTVVGAFQWLVLRGAGHTGGVVGGREHAWVDCRHAARGPGWAARARGCLRRHAGTALVWLLRRITPDDAGRQQDS